MGLGATIKVAMDSSAVKRGIAGIRGMFSRLGGVVRGLGGAMRKAMIPGAALIGAFGYAGKRVADLGSELSDMAVQTGVSVEKLVMLQEALRMAGVPMRDTSRALSLLASNLQEALTPGGQSIRDALGDLGFMAGDFNGVPIDEAFQMILERIRDSGDEIKGLESAMESLFGARMGFGILRLAKDLDDNMERAAKSSASFGKFMGQNANTLDKTADALGRIGMLFNEVIGRLLVKLPLEDIARTIEGLDIDAISAKIGNFISDPIGSIAEIGRKIGEGFVDVLLSAAEAIGQEIKKGLFGEGGILGGAKGFFGLGSKNGGQGKGLSGKIDTTNALLRRIERGGAIYV